MPRQRASQTPRFEMDTPTTLRRRIRNDMNEFLTPEFEAAFEKLKYSLAQSNNNNNIPLYDDANPRRTTPNNDEVTPIDDDSLLPQCGKPELCVHCATVAEVATRLLFALRLLQLILFAFRIVAGCRWKLLELIVSTCLMLAFFVEEVLRFIKFGRAVYYASVWRRLYAALWSADARLLVGLVAIIVSNATHAN